MANYDEFCIVAEEQCVCVQKPQLSEGQYDVLLNIYGISARDTVVLFSSQQTSWEFTIKNNGPYVMRIECKNTNKVPNHPVVAELVMWQWVQNNNDSHLQSIIGGNNLINQDDDVILDSGEPVDCDIHFLIRPLGKRKLVEDLCRPLYDSDAFTISVGDQNFVVSAHRLMQVSPYFRAMLTHETSERAERKMEVNDADAEPELYRALLEVIDPDQSVHPNPTNVVGVLKLANYFQVELAKERCERHLINCVELPLIERLQLANDYRLNKLKESILSIGSVKLRALYNANVGLLTEEHFRRELLDELHSRLNDIE